MGHSAVLPPCAASRFALVVSALLAPLVVLAGCGRTVADGDRPLPRPTRGYILISIDTLRADHLGCYGYRRPTSPFLDELASRATLFEEAYAQFPSTLVSHMSIFTGLYPREHGVLPPNQILSPAIPTLPEGFHRNGFRTAGFTEGGYVSGRFGFRRGFDEFVSRERSAPRSRNQSRPVAGTFRRAAAFLEELEPGARFFLFIHTYAVHTPYDAPALYREPFWPGPPPADAIPATGPALVRANMQAERPPQAVIDYLTAQYDAGIRQTDAALREFFADLGRLGLLRETTVIVTADHGEEFMEHGLFAHTQLYRETLRVPLLVIHSDRAAVRDSGVVQLVDLAPTLYELAGIRPPGRLSGTSFARRIGRSQPPPPGAAWGEALDGVRSLYRGMGRNLKSVILTEPPAEAWLPRRVAFDAPDGDLVFRARSFREDRQLTVLAAGKTVSRAKLTTAWSAVRVGAAGPRRLVLETDDCAIPEAEEDSREPRCFAFQVEGLPLGRVEVYDVTRDPGQRRDLSREPGSGAHALLKELLAFAPRALVAPPTATPLDPALRRNLRSLGYLK